MIDNFSVFKTPTRETFITVHVALTTKNPRDLRLILTYTNNQLCYYYMTKTMLNADKTTL